MQQLFSSLQEQGFHTGAGHHSHLKLNNWFLIIIMYNNLSKLDTTGQHSCSTSTVNPV